MVDDVLEILKINRDNERQAGLDQLPVLPPRPNRRRRDYWIMLAIVNGFFAATMLLGRGYVPVVVYSLSGMVLFTAGITWILYGVMDRY